MAWDASANATRAGAGLTELKIEDSNHHDWLQEGTVVPEEALGSLDPVVSSLVLAGEMSEVSHGAAAECSSISPLSEVRDSLRSPHIL